MHCLLLLALALQVTTRLCSADRASFDCKMRQLAMDYAHKIQPWLSDVKFQEIADALDGSKEARNCEILGRISPGSLNKSPSFPIPLSSPTDTFYVDASKGSDINSGSKNSPFMTIPRAVMEARSQQSPSSMIVLRGGVYYLTDTITLDERDSGLAIQNYPEEEVIISGGRVITPEWHPANIEDPMNIYEADLTSEGLKSVTGFRVNGKRAIRARYPNADPETEGFASKLKAISWLPPKVYSNQHMEYPDTPHRYSSDLYQYFHLGLNGSCINFEPPGGYWCGNRTAGGAAHIYRVPSGMVANEAVLPNQPYKNATGSIVHAWRPFMWASWMFEVGDYDSATGTFVFSRGGFQDARGKNRGDEFYIENVLEELDYANEWFYDTSTKSLYYFYNASSGTRPPEDALYIVPVLKTLISVKASQASPARGITIRGIKFRDTAYSYMDPHGMPSGGDWSLPRNAALYFEGTVNGLIQECVFEHLDGNAVMISRYNRNMTVYKSEFAWIGDTAIALWGDTRGSEVSGMGWDGTEGNQPRFTNILYNFVHELGIFKKASSFYFQTKSCQNLIRGNIVFNGPQAGIVFNDGFGGGNNVTENLLFNLCREAEDHGPFNSWDRQVYVTKVWRGYPDTRKEWDHIFQNFIIANYNSLLAIDNDDGSAYYKSHENFLAYSSKGMRTDFGGHDNHHYNNIYGYVKKGFDVCSRRQGHTNYFFNNTVIQTHDGKYGVERSCDDKDGRTVVHNNHIYTPGGRIYECGMALREWQALGNDPATTASKLPQDEEIIKMVKKLLRIPVTEFSTF